MGILDTIRDMLGLNQHNMEEYADFNDDIYDNDEDREYSESPDERMLWHPAMVHPDEEVQVIYRGLLEDSGAQNLYLHYGFDHWRQPIETVPMVKQPNGEFVATITAQGDSEINLCFVDSNGNWDNNNKFNWTIDIDDI